MTLNDPRERELPYIGMIKMKDAETGIERWIDTSNSLIQKSFRQYWSDHESRLRHTLLSTKVDRINVEIDKPYIRPLVDFFKMRESRI